MELHDSGPEKFGEDDATQLQNSDIATPAAAAGAASQTTVTRVLNADAAGVVVLPAGTELGDIRIEGRDLVVIGADGVRYVIPDGAIIVPQLVIDDVAIPPLNLAALLVGNEPQPAAGNPQSSGGNFASAVGPIQAAYGLGDLLPYTELNFPQPEEREIIPNQPDREPTITIITVDQPVGAQSATATVAESGLPARNGEPAGTNSAAATEATSGTIVFSSPDGVASITINGVPFTGVGQVISSPRGDLLITSFDPVAGTIGFTYTLTDNLVGGTLADQFTISLADPDGDVATATLTVSATDDAPIARNDTDAVAAGSYAAESGNVVTAAGTTSGPAGADTPGADGAAVSRIASNNVPANTDTTFDAAGNLQVTGQYGTLLIKADGSYTYTRAAGTPGGVTDAFTYTLTDADGSTSTATLTISIGDAMPVVTSVPPTGVFEAGTLVFESGLPSRPGEAPGTNAPAPTETTSGKVTFTGGDGPVTATINGVAVAPGATVTVPGVGTLVVDTFDPVTGELTYTFTLADNTSGDNTSATFNVVITDVDGDTAPGTFVIAIRDDAPQAIDDSATQAVENAPISVNVLANDIPGADSVQPATVQLVAGTLSGTGTLVNNGDGTFTYTPGPGENGPVTFDYSITDGDGDSSSATVTIALIADSTPVVGEGPNLSVDEDGFGNANVDATPLQANPAEVAAGANLGDSGTVKVDFGGDVPADLAASIVLLDDPAYDGQLRTLDGNPVTFAVESGVLIGRDSGGAEVIRVTVTGAVAGPNPGEVVYTYSTQLSQPVQHGTPGTEDTVTLSGVTFQVTDLDGDMATGSFSVTIWDDVPTAVNDGPFGVVEDGSSSISGNVLTNDLSGADTPKVFTQWSAANAAEVADLNTYGTLTLNADGSWSYVLDNSRAATQALTAADLKTYTLDYTMADADGDPSPATLTITITGSDDTATVVTAQAVGPDNTVYEAGLNPDGSAAAGTSETDTGSFTVSASDGIATVTIGGQAFTLAQVQAFATTNGVVDTGEGTLTLTGYTGSATSGTVSYSYTLKATIDNDSKTGATGTAFDDSITIAVAGVGGSSGSDDLVVRIVDDVPTAVNDGPFGVVEDGSSSISGNVLTNDLSGADTPKVFTQWSAANAAEVADLNTYGTLTLNADGSWSYVLDNSRAATQALTAADLKTYTLDYTMADADGDPSPATLTITITGSDDTATVVTAQAVGPDNTVYEAGLNPDGSAAAGTSETDTGSFTVSASDGIATVTIGGQAFTLAQVQAFATTNGVVDTGEGTLTLTGYTGSATSGTVSYSYTLKATIDNDSKTGATGTAFDDSITIAVAGVGGSSGSDDLVVRIVDDVPTAVNDGPFGVVEDGSSSISGNVLTNDLSGADTPKVFTQWSAANAAEVADLNTYGTLTLNADGSWSYVLDNSRAATQALTAADLKTYTLDYTMADADGDPSPATLTITITGSDDTATVVTAQAVGPDNTVYEAGLNPDGSAAAGTSETDTGSFTVSASDGIATVTIGGQAFTLAQVQAFATTNGVVDTGEGTLTLTGYTGSATSGTVSYSYTLKATIDNDSKTGATGTAFDDSITIAVAGVGGSSGSDDLVVRIVDDVPTAILDTAMVTEGGTVAKTTLITGVLGNDKSGADLYATAGAVDGVRASGGDNTTPVTGGVGLGTPIAGLHGTLTLYSDGTYSYKANADAISTNAQDVFVYTIKDGDGDTSTTTLTIDITAVTLTPDNQSKQVDEAALDITTSGADLGNGTVTGTNPSLTTETVTGTLNVTGSTGITYVTQNIVTTYGLFKLNADGTYTYTLTKPYTTTPAANDGAVVPTGGFETLGYTAMDANGNTVGGTVTITIKDDVPTAVVAAMASGNNATGTTFNANLDAGTGDGNIDNNYGADGGKAIFTAASIASLQSQNLSSGLSSLNYAISADGTVLTATKVGDASLVFTITLDPVSADDKYVVSINQPLDSISNVDFTGNAYQFVGGNTAWAGFVPTGEPVTGTDNNSKDLLLTPAVGGANASTINQSSVQYGVGSGNSIGLGSSNNPATAETFRLDFVTDLRGNSAGAGGYGDPTNQDHVFDGHYQTNGASVFFTASNGTTLKFAAFDDYDGNTAVGDGVLDAITGVALSYRGFTTGVIIPTTTTQTFTIGPVGDQHTYTITANGDGTVNVGGLYGTSGAQANGTSVAIYTDTTGPLAPGETLAGYNSLQFTYVSGDEIKVGNFGATIITNEPVNFTVPFSLQDGDGDITPSGNLSVMLNPVVPPIALDLDGNGVEFTSLAAGTTLDYGSGLVQSAWVGGNDGLLAIDLNGDGKVSGQELAFGGGDTTDLEGLAARYDTNHDGVLDASDADFTKFGVWQDANGNGVSEAGEFRTLTEAGIVSISLKSDAVGYTAAGGDVTVFGSSTFTRADGTTGVVADAAFATQARAEQRTAEIVSMAALAGAVVDAVPVAAQPALPVEEKSQALPTLQPVAVQSELDMNAGDATSKSSMVIPDPAANAVDEPGDATAHFAGETTDARMIANDTAFDHASDAPAWLAADAGPSSAGASVGLFSAMATDGTMQALLSIAPQAPATDAARADAALTAIDSALSDFTGEALVDSIVEQFAAAGHHGPIEAGAAAIADIGPFTLMQGIGGAGADFATINLPDAHDDASMLAAAQA